MDRCEYPQILKFIDAKIPGFFEKYPGYKIFLLKLQYFSMILKEEPRDKIMHFFNKDLFPLLNKYAIKDLDQDYFDFKTLIEETNIIKCRTYKQAWKNACQIFMEGISLCFDNLFLIQENKNNSSIYNEYNKNKENFAKEVNTLFRFEKVINEYYQSYKSDEFHLYEPENISATFKLVGHYPSVYAKKNIPVFGRYSFLVKGNEIMVSFNADPKIYVMSLSGEPLYSFGVADDLISGVYPETVTFEDFEEANKTWFYVLNATTNNSEWVARSDLMSYLNNQDKTHRLKCSVVEYTPAKKREDRPKFIENIFFSHVVLSKRPEVNIEAQIEQIKEHCRQYRGVGIPEPNRILEDGNKLIVIWRYSKESSGQELPGRALLRWKATQECLNHYFDAIDVSLAQKSTMLLPLSGFSSVNVVYENPALKYLFDTVARAVLPFSQKEVAENKAEKQNRPRRSIALEDLTAEYVARREAEGRKSRFNPALKIFNDIVRLLKIRALNGVDDEVPEGRRELCVFYALNFAVQAGLVKGEGTEDFNELAQKLINFCGKSFTFDCTPNVMTTLRNKFALGQEVYRPKKKTLISRLSITSEEQAELDILKEDVPKSEKHKKIPVWEILGISKATYYRREKKAKEISEKLREISAQYLAVLWIADKVSQLQASGSFWRQVRLKNSAYYERGGVAGRTKRRSFGVGVGVSRELQESQWGDNSWLLIGGNIQEFERPPPS